MGLFGISFGSKKQKSSSRTNQRRQSQTQSRVQQTGSESAKQQQAVTTLAPEVQSALQDVLLSQLQNGQQQTQLVQDLVNTVLQQAQTAPQAFDPTAVINEARRRGENALMRNVTNLAQATGSSQNSFVQQIASQGAADLESQLAALQQELNIKGHQAAQKELVAASQLPVANVLPLVQALKGATTTGTTTTDTQSQRDVTSTEQLLEIIKAITNATGKSSGFGFNLGLGS